jgi:hypothetical protein
VAEASSEKSILKTSCIAFRQVANTAAEVRPVQLRAAEAAAVAE